MKDFWEARYSEKELAYGAEPNAFFAAELSKLKPGRLLLPADGQGRNAVWAAKQGWEVEAFDYSEAGQKRALELAEAEGVTINFRVEDARDFQPANAPYDAIGLVFAHFPPEIRQVFHPRLVEWLRPGGSLIFEAYHKEQLGRDSGGPKALPFLFNREEIIQEFPSIERKVLQKETVQLSEGNYHIGEAVVMRMVGTK